MTAPATSPTYLPLTPVAPTSTGSSVSTHVVARSGNKKLGASAATYRTLTSCPTTCPFRPDDGGGCYGTGRIFGIAQRLGKDTGDYDDVTTLAATLPKGYTLRLNVVGDFLLPDGSPDWDYINACNLVALKRPDLTIIAYTHAWRTLTPDVFAFTVNASCEGLNAVLQARAAGWEATIVVEDFDADEMGQRVAERRVIPCPQQIDDRVTCAACKLCSKADRPTVVAFATHGTAKNKARASVERSK